jgi:thiamine-phosphate pyrophosphorylase
MEKTGKTKTAYLQGLYAITPTAASDADTLARQVEQAVEGGARLIQYRNKSPNSPVQQAARFEEARALLSICRHHQVPLIINDDVALAAKLDADGVHLGGEDMACLEARERLGPRAIIGISCYNQVDRALTAQAQGADYVAFGRFFPSRSKPQAVQAELGLLQQARQQLRIPIAAIGGITPENCRALIAAGADMLAVINAVFGEDDVKAAAQRFSRCFSR